MSIHKTKKYRKGKSIKKTKRKRNRTKRKYKKGGRLNIMRKLREKLGIPIRGGQNLDDSGKTDKEDISDDELDISNISNISFDTFMSTDTPNSFLMALNPPTEDTEDSLMLSNISDTSLMSPIPRAENPHAHYLEMEEDLDLSSDDDEEPRHARLGGKRHKKSNKKTRKHKK